jgi:hypothetical protein
MNTYRKKQIVGHVVDGAGNAIPDTKVTIRRVVPKGSVQVGATKSGLTGLFKTRPLPAGLYEIYESGVYSQSIEHNVDSIIPCYIGDYVQPVFQPTAPNAFNTRLRIELDSSFFPCYKVEGGFGQYTDIKYVTYTRFDVELLTSKGYVRWSGVPGVKVGDIDSPAHLLLDYQGMSFARPYKIDSPVTVSYDNANGVNIITYPSSDGMVFRGDVIEVITNSVARMFIATKDSLQGDSNKKNVTCKPYSGKKPLEGASYSSTGHENVTSGMARFHHGMISSRLQDDISVADYFTVVENTTIGAIRSELYTY